MISRIVLVAAAAFTLGAFAAAPAPAQAAALAAPAVSALNADAASNVVEVRHRKRWRRAWRHYRRWHAPHFAYYYAPRHCGYVWRPHRGRLVYRCW
jgi:hypothetical protein